MAAIKAVKAIKPIKAVKAIKAVDDYVIACRSYKRATVFPEKTYRMLSHNGLTDRLYIFVANKEEKDLYEAALKDQGYKQIVIGKLGGANAINAICNFFPKGQRILFVDDDLNRFFTFDKEGTYTKDSKALHRYIEDGFDSIDRYDMGAFTFSFLSNKFYLKGKPFKEFRPFILAGNFFGTRNDPAMITTKPYTSHADDSQRTCRYIDHYGGILVYWWGGFDTHYGKEEGGLQASGDRGSAAERLKKTEEISWRMYEEDPLIRAYCQEPTLMGGDTLYSLKLKTLPQIRKAQNERGVPIRHATWDWWTRNPNK